MLLFRLITDLSVFLLDFTQECKTTVEIGILFDEMCDNFLLFIIQERTKAQVQEMYGVTVLGKTLDPKLIVSCYLDKSEMLLLMVTLAPFPFTGMYGGKKSVSTASIHSSSVGSVRSWHMLNKIFSTSCSHWKKKMNCN